MLTGTAATIWHLIDGSRTQASIEAELSEQYDDVDGQMSAQLTSFLADLEAQFLIEQEANDT